MKKLFEIPIYACSPSVFSIRVRKHKETLSSEHLQSYRKIDDDQIRQTTVLRLSSSSIMGL